MIATLLADAQPIATPPHHEEGERTLPIGKCSGAFALLI